jgi:hypothetical protein
MGKMRNTYIVLGGNLERNRPLGRSKRRKKDNIKMNFDDVGCEHAD